MNWFENYSWKNCFWRSVVFSTINKTIAIQVGAIHVQLLRCDQSAISWMKYQEQFRLTWQFVKIQHNVKVSDLSIPLFSKENTVPHIAHNILYSMKMHFFFCLKLQKKTVTFEPSLLRFAFLKLHSTNNGCHLLNKPKKTTLAQ